VRREKLRFHLVMLGCGGFIVLALASLVYVCSRPQTASVQASEQAAIAQCWQRSRDPERTEIYRRAQADSCREMHEQYVHKFGPDAAT
jgi:hypothetical protein